MQKHMLVGELAMCGRLNQRSFGYEFVRVILPGSPQVSVATQDDPRVQAARAEIGLSPNDFAVLWCGGYNTWTDVDTLFNGIDAAMSSDQRVRYVSVGASTYDAPRTMYERFVEMARGSPHADRYHMLGWRPWTEVPMYYASCQLGLNIDAMHYETVYGTRTRLVEMISAGLPVITTEGTHLSALLQRSGAALTFRLGDYSALSHHVVALAQDAARREQMAQRARRTASEELSFAATTAPLRDWVRAPRVAPDRSRRILDSHPLAARHRIRALLRYADWRLRGRHQ
jgi:hypothetical protein